MAAPKLIESIRLLDGKFYNLDYHSARMNRSCRVLGIEHQPYQLSKFLSHISFPKTGLYKCRVLYDERIHTVHFQKYTTKAVKSLKIVHADDIEYGVKYLERKELTSLYNQRGDCDDIIIVKNGLVTDSYYGNLLFLKDGKWYTPESYLLAGTQRQALLDRGVIETITIRVEDISKFEKVKIVNAMLDLDQDILNLRISRIKNS